jgi:ribosomal RNA-processing protein 7
MPKTTKPSAVKASSALSKSSGKGKLSQPKLYSGFLPIALSLPIPTTIPSSSSKPLHELIHHIYVRAQKTTSTGEDDDSESTRTAFICNLPVDISERDLRSVFTRWGVVESMEIGNPEGGNVLEDAVRGLDADSDDEDEVEEEEEEEGQGETAERSEPQFVGDGKPLPRRLRSRRKNVLPPSVPDIIPLPTLNPRSTPYAPSGRRCAHLTYLDSISLTRLLSHPITQIIHLPKYSNSPANPTGLSYYLSLHSTLRPSLVEIKEYADSSMARFDHLHSLLLSSRAKKQGAGALVDEDGFTVVVRGGRYGRTGGRGPGALGVGVASGKVKDARGKDSLGAMELPDFYRFQKTDRKRQGQLPCRCNIAAQLMVLQNWLI